MAASLNISRRKAYPVYVISRMLIQNRTNRKSLKQRKVGAIGLRVFVFFFIMSEKENAREIGAPRVPVFREFIMEVFA